MSREVEVREAVDRFVAHVRQATDSHLQALASDLLAIARGDSRTARLDLERAAVDVARAVAKGGVQARRDLIGRLALSVRRLDEAATLRGILEALAEGAAVDAARVAVLLVDGDTLRAYRNHGYTPGSGPVDLSVDASPLLANAIKLRQPTPVGSAGDRPDPSVARFMQVPPGHTGLVVPLAVGGSVVALVYADGVAREDGQDGAPVWSDEVEVLARHAAARLEMVTSKRTTEVLQSS